jgi:hypothetical protein
MKKYLIELYRLGAIADHRIAAGRSPLAGAQYDEMSLRSVEEYTEAEKGAIGGILGPECRPLQSSGEPDQPMEKAGDVEAQAVTEEEGNPFLMNEGSTDWAVPVALPGSRRTQSAQPKRSAPTGAVSNDP